MSNNMGSAFRDQFLRNPKLAYDCFSGNGCALLVVGSYFAFPSVGSRRVRNCGESSTELDTNHTKEDESNPTRSEGVRAI